jgi:hypothetical protein
MKEARQSRSAKEPQGHMPLACVAPDRTRKVRVYGAGKPIMAKRVAADATRAKVLRREHAPRSHDAHERVERGLVGILSSP